MEAKKKSWTSALFAYAEGEKSRLLLSVVLSVLSVMLGLVPFYCMYRLICLMAAGTATAALAVKWCLLALAAYAAKVVLFGLSTGTSHAMAYTILEGLRLRLADRFLHAPLGNVENHTIGEIKTMMVDKIETLEPPLAHMIPEGAGHVVLPVVSIIALLCVDWRLALANKGVITAPEAALAVMLSISMVGSLAKLEVFSENMRQVKFTVEGLEEFLEMPELSEPAERAEISHTDVALRDAHFSYTGEEKDEVLHGIDLTLPEGSFTALVGPSGGGKSTVAKLIARFWDVTSGAITIGGVNVKDMPLSQLSEYVSFVTQDNFLFRCSLLENIRLGNPNATDEEVKAAARAAQCEEFISKLPQGYDTPAGEAGKRLSGGEKQRISIARAILKNAPIIILDEATASIDPENEHLIQQAISALTRGKTIITIAHRLATVQNADQILVVDDGRIAQHGTHDQLVKQEGLYRRFTAIRQQAEGWRIAAE